MALKLCLDSWENDSASPLDAGMSICAASQRHCDLDCAWQVAGHRMGHFGVSPQHRILLGHAPDMQFFSEPRGSHVGLRSHPFIPQS